MDRESMLSSYFLITEWQNTPKFQKNERQYIIIDPLEVKIIIRQFYEALHSNTLAWEIPWTEEPGRLQSMGSLRVRHD